jgi:hypothetical protein
MMKVFNCNGPQPGRHKTTSELTMDCYDTPVDDQLVVPTRFRWELAHGFHIGSCFP